MAQKENLTKTYIYKAFILLLEKNNFNDISVCDIAQKAGVSRMSFYRNFASKEDLVFKGLEELFKKVHDQVENNEIKSQYTIAKSLFEVFRPLKNCLASFQNSNISKSFTDMIAEKLSKNLPNDYMNKTSRYIAIFYIGAVSTTLLAWLRNGAEEEPEDMAKLIASLIDIDDI